MRYFLEYSYPLISILIVASAVIFQQPLIFVLLAGLSLITLLRNRKQYFLLVLFCFLSFYGSYALFNIEPLLAPMEIKIGKDIIWIVLLILILPLIRWHEFIKTIPRQIFIAAILFTSYVLIHALFINHTWTERGLELRNYLEYLPLLFIPTLLLRGDKEVLKKSLIGFSLIGLFVAVLTLTQDKIPSISMLGSYRANSTLPNFFHLGIFLNSLILIGSALFVLKLKKSFNWVWLSIGIMFLLLFTYSSLLTDSRGLAVALLIAWVGLIAFLLKGWRGAWVLIIPGIFSYLLFFTVGPDWARSRYQDFLQQINSPLLVSKVVTQESALIQPISTPSADLNSTSTPTPVIVPSTTSSQSAEIRSEIVEEKKLDQILKGQTLLIEEKAYITSHSQDRSLVIRIFNINKSLEKLKSSPLFGQGLLLKDDDPNTAYATDFFFLDILVQLGFVGTILFFGIIISILGRCVIVYKETKDSQQKILLSAFIWVIVLYLLSSLTTSSWIAFPVNALFWLFAGIGLYLTLPDQGEFFEKSAKK